MILLPVHCDPHGTPIVQMECPDCGERQYLPPAILKDPGWLDRRLAEPCRRCGSDVTTKPSDDQMPLFGEEA